MSVLKWDAGRTRGPPAGEGARCGGQAQYIERPVPDATANDTSAARQWALQNLHEPLTLTDLAEHSHMSLRTFARRFNEESA